MQYSYLSLQDVFSEPRPRKKPPGVIKTDYIFARGVKIKKLYNVSPSSYTITMCNNNNQ